MLTLLMTTGALNTTPTREMQRQLTWRCIGVNIYLLWNSPAVTGVAVELMPAVGSLTNTAGAAPSTLTTGTTFLTRKSSTAITWACRITSMNKMGSQPRLMLVWTTKAMWQTWATPCLGLSQCSPCGTWAVTSRGWTAAQAVEAAVI